MEVLLKCLKKIGVLVGSMMIALGPMFIGLGAWSDALSTEFVGTIAPIVGGIIVAWLGASPITPVKK